MRSRRFRLFTWALVIALQLSLLTVAAPGSNAPFPGADATLPVSDTLSATGDSDHYYHLLIEPNRQLRAVLTTQKQLEADMALWPATSTPVADFTQALAHDTGSGTRSELIYNRHAEKPGDVSIDVRAVSGAGGYTLIWQLLDAVTLDVSSSASVIPYAGYATLRGVLNDDYTSVTATGQPVTLWYSYDRKHWHRSSARPKVNQSTGQFSFQVRPSIKSWYRIATGGLNGVGYAISPASSVTPKVYLSKPSTPSSVRRNSYFTAYGYLKPRHTSGGKSVKFYFDRKERGKWVRRATVWAVNKNYSSYTRFSVRTRLTLAGSWRVRAYHSTPEHAATYSDYRTFTVK